ncbi:MAG TPA: rhodanese-like domain-containing protein [Anaeromyxobacteraceae bacterium]|nr:rhodanese-like domain-containing protein [Anaeromyxobacteraceae bacterium]
MKSFVAALVLGVGVAVASPVVAAAEAAAVDVKPGVVSGATARTLAAAGAKVVDVRTPEEFAAGHVPGAVNVPYDELPRRAAEIGPPSTAVVLYCRSGRRSGIAAEALRKAGFTKVYDFQSVSAWPGELVK